MMRSLLEQLKKRRLALGLKQKDMMLRIGVSRQQYQHLESKGNPRLNTLELIAKGLKSELMLIPTEKLSLVKEILENDKLPPSTLKYKDTKQSEEDTLADDPWKDMLEGDE
ncbi:MAG: helix-turn-helix domain-containing protein [gamma proteobacterium symbiont of Bathyaustriella thionipta]|nr:helix-turn-helix domain-containing protein [gamma proteobacterium symbiont of Bathyaustriella thionipta]MCU7949004.1 helix-turn-helix domain-containing protein [gamma proteobacterium symbiont of Bathyaustriella thionipta]MCU7952204.1 helix-turn-helix domain-containing protein [gamma proteobacterium symbiont of Bathyaustriella thionipta]MCU7955588.1 helix-turn-helix domain-containing protein [gamma proteobacterium symbiont of Bathyaustriella thionipta]MCU7967735.1 helix-turn-helix domain-cont